MGYTTEFKGVLKITPPLTVIDYTYLRNFVDTDHRDTHGTWRAYCQWEPSPDGEYLQWDGGEKFYNYIEWLKELVTTFFIPQGYRLDGKLIWQGEEIGDRGKITVENNEVTAVTLE